MVGYNNIDNHLCQIEYINYDFKRLIMYYFWQMINND